MAITECRECQQTVAREATLCPHCGAKNPATTKERQQFAQRLVIGTAIGLFVLYAIGTSIPDRKDVSEVSGDGPDVIDDRGGAGSDGKWTFDERAKYYRRKATQPCVKAIEAQAKYDFEWTNSLFEPQLSHYRPSTNDQLAIVYVGDGIKFQNGFGSWIRHTYVCEYRVPSESVTFVKVSPGRL